VTNSGFKTNISLHVRVFTLVEKTCKYNAVYNNQPQFTLRAQNRKNGVCVANIVTAVARVGSGQQQFIKTNTQVVDKTEV